MKAKVKDSYLVGRVTAFGGLEYTNKEWRDVPPGSEEEARRHPFLDVHEPKAEAAKAAPDLPERWQAEPVAEAEPEPEPTPEPTAASEAEGKHEPSRATQQRNGSRKRRGSNR